MTVGFYLSCRQIQSNLSDEVSTICVSRWDQEDSGDESLTHPLTRMVLTPYQKKKTGATQMLSRAGELISKSGDYRCG